MTLTEGQGKRSRSNQPQNGQKKNQLAISKMLFQSQTLYLVPRYIALGAFNDLNADDLDHMLR